MNHPSQCCNRDLKRDAELTEKVPTQPPKFTVSATEMGKKLFPVLRSDAGPRTALEILGIVGNVPKFCPDSAAETG